MSDTIRKDPTEEKTVVVKKSDIEQQLHRADEEKTVLDTVNEGYKSIFDPELEEILRETEGYELTPQDEDGEPEYEEEPEYDESESDAERIIREQSEHRAHKKRKKLIIVCVAIVAVLAAMLALILALKNGGTESEYSNAFKQAQEYYYAGDYRCTRCV